MSQRDTIFEGAFSYRGTFAKVDILKPVSKGEWDVIEVKSSTQVRDEHINHHYDGVTSVGYLAVSLKFT